MSLVLTDIKYVSPSQLGTLGLCPRRWWWRYVAGLRSEGTEATAMGGGFATALEFGDVERGIAEYHERRPQPDDWTDPAVDARHIAVADATIRAAFEGYLSRWPDEGVEREVTYLTDLDQPRILQARLDGVAPTCIIEDKLRSGTSMRSDAIENEVRQGRQLTAEAYSVWRATGELLPVHLRCVKKTDPRKWRSADPAEIPAIIGDHFAGDGVFHEFIATRTVEDFKRFEDEAAQMIALIESMDDEDRPLGHRNLDACHAYGRPCEALARCQGTDA